MLFDRAGIQMGGEAHRVHEGGSQGVVGPGAWSYGVQGVVRGRVGHPGVSGSKSFAAAPAPVVVVQGRVGTGAFHDNLNSSSYVGETRTIERGNFRPQSDAHPAYH